MKKNSKKPEVRKQELIEIASRLFEAKGFESVSVRDILAEVNGAPGMFYYYFKSKQDIYVATIEQYIENSLQKRSEIINDEAVPFAEKREIMRKLVLEDMNGYIKKFNPSLDLSITNSSYKLWEFSQMLNKLHELFTVFILQGVREGYLLKELGEDERKASANALYLVYGTWGVLYNSYFTPCEEKHELSEVFPIINKLFYGTPQEKT